MFGHEPDPGVLVVDGGNRFLHSTLDSVDDFGRGPARVLRCVSFFLTGLPALETAMDTLSVA